MEAEPRLAEAGHFKGGKSALLLAQWSRGVAELVGLIGKAGFEAALLQAVRRLIDFDFIMVFAYRGQARPLALGDTLTLKQRKVVIEDYMNEPYLLDPFFQKALSGAIAGCYRLHDLAPDRFRQSEYFRAHYHFTAIREEVGFFFRVPGDVTGVVSLARWAESPRLAQKDMTLLQVIEPVVGALAAAHWAEAGSRGELGEGAGRKPAESGQISNAYRHFGQKLLSERERQIVTLVLQGHSSESIARRLDISPGTVKIHRKNIYRKLGISTQGELFAAFLSFVG